MPPPPLYDLTELQRHANRLFGFSAQKTLDVAQALYEKRKLISYPRTDSRHLSQDVAATLPQIVKTNGNRSDFDVERIRIGFQRALHKRPVPTEYVDAAIDRIVQQVLSLGEREIPSRQIGEMVMQELYRLDKVAYIRFASVYRSFQDVSDFRDALKEVEAPLAVMKRTKK